MEFITEHASVRKQWQVKKTGCTHSIYQEKWFTQIVYYKVSIVAHDKGDDIKRQVMSLPDQDTDIGYMVDSTNLKQNIWRRKN